MSRSLFLAIGLLVAAPAFACGGDSCDKAHCKMKSTEEVASALARVDAAQGDKLTITVKGMRCGACSDKVTGALTAVDGVHAAAVSQADGQARVAYDAGKVDVTKLVSAIRALGFEAELAEST